VPLASNCSALVVALSKAERKKKRCTDDEKDVECGGKHRGVAAAGAACGRYCNSLQGNPGASHLRPVCRSGGALSRGPHHARSSLSGVVRTTPQLVSYRGFTASTALGKEKTMRLQDKIGVVSRWKKKSLFFAH
jgi:hypothetical protein